MLHFDKFDKISSSKDTTGPFCGDRATSRLFLVVNSAARQIRRIRAAISVTAVRYEVTGITLGIVLIVASSLKAAEYIAHPSRPSASILATHSWLGLALVEAEFAMGLWLILGVHRRLARLFALVLFSAFAIASSYSLLQGASSCGCLGKVHAHPWLMLAFDLAAVAALLLCRPKFGSCS